MAIDARVLQNALGKISEVANQVKDNLQYNFNTYLPKPPAPPPPQQPIGPYVNTKFGQIPFQGPDRVLGSRTGPAPIPSVVPTPTPTPQPQTNDGFIFDYNTLPRDQYYAQNGPRPNFQPQQPPAEVGSLIREFFPNDATASAAVFASENATFDPNRPDNINKKDGSRDRGIPQINEKTFNGLMERQGNTLREQGITSFEDMRDPRKSLIVARMIRDGARSYQPDINPEGWAGWFGWADTGYNLNKGWYDAPLRGWYEEYKKTMSPEKALEKAKRKVEEDKKKK